MYVLTYVLCLGRRSAMMHYKSGQFQGLHFVTGNFHITIIIIMRDCPNSMKVGRYKTIVVGEKQDCMAVTVLNLLGLLEANNSYNRVVPLFFPTDSHP